MRELGTVALARAVPLLVWIAAAAGAPTSVEAQEGLEKVRVICDVADPKNNCPGVNCVCIEDTLEITFDGDTQSVFEYAAFEEGLPIEVTVVNDTRTEGTQAWAYGVLHDKDRLEIVSATTDGTDAGALIKNGFNATRFDNIQTCDVAPGCPNRTDGGGWINAFVLSFTDPIVLPLGRNTLARASYRLRKDVGPGGTLLQVTDRLATKGTEPVPIDITKNQRSRKWTRVVDGWVKAAAGAPEEKTQTLCDPADPKNKCPGADCLCTDDTLEVTFDGDADTIFEYSTFTQGLPVEITVVTDTRTEGVDAWGYGVMHDIDALTLTSATMEGTDAAALADQGFQVTMFRNIVTCDTAPECYDRTPGGGWISACILSFVNPVVLPLKRNTVGKASYVLQKDVGTPGTLILVTDRLAEEHSPPPGLNLMVAGKRRLWTLGIAGWVKAAGSAVVPFVRGDVGMSGRADEHPADGVLNVTDSMRILGKLFLSLELEFDCPKAADVDDSGSLDITDGIYILDWLFLGHAPPPAPFAEAGEDPTPDGLGCVRYP